MSKSLGNYIGVTEAPDAMYAKLMSISDELMWRYYTLLTDLSPDGIEEEQAAGRPDGLEDGARAPDRGGLPRRRGGARRRRPSGAACTRSARRRATCAW